MRAYGFSKTIQNRESLIKIFEILDDKIEIKNRILILPNNYKELIGDLQKNLSELYSETMTQNEYEEYIQRCLLKQKLEEQKRLKEIEEQKKLKDKIKILCEGKEYRDKQWIDRNIGEYYTWDNAIEYFWTIIGNDYKQTWNGDIILENEMKKKIQKIGSDIVGLKGSTFLGRRFKFKGKYSHGFDLDKGYTKEKVKAESYGVYGIYKDDVLIYIGSTMRDFSVRFNEHIENIKNNSKELHVYSLLQEGNITFKKLIDIKKLQTNSNITKRDLESMELALINTMQPIGNLAGRVCEFKYSE